MFNTLPQIRRQGRSDCSACKLRHEALCSDVHLEGPADFRAAIDALVYDHDSVLYPAGAPVDAVYCVRAGAVKMMRVGPTGKHRIVRVLGAGDIAGIESAFSEAFEDTAIAVGKVRACRIPIACLRRLVAEHRELHIRLLEKLQDALRQAETWLSQVTGGATLARTRMARLMLCLRVGEGNRIHRFSTEDMGAIIGSTPETVSRIVAEFGRQGIVAKGGSQVATRRCFRGDISALEKIAQEV